MANFPAFWKKSSASHSALETEQTQLVEYMLSFALIIAVPMYTIAVYQTVAQQLWSTLFFFTAGIILLALAKLLKGLPNTVRGSILILVGLTIAIEDIGHFGLTGSGLLYLLTTVFASALIFDIRAGVATIILSTGILAFFGFSLGADAIDYSTTSAYLVNRPIAWAIRAAEITFLGGLILFSLYRLLSRLSLTITKNDKLARQAEDNRLRLNEIVTAIPGNVLICSKTPQLEVLWANLVAQSTFNIDLQQSEKTVLREMLLTASNDNIQLIDAILEQKSVVNHELRLQTAEKETLWFRGAARQFDYAGQDAVLLILDDIQELKEAQETLNHLERVETLGLMAGGIAHDFNNLLVGMMAQNDIALRIVGENSKAARHITKAFTAAERATEVTRQLLAYSGHARFNLAQFNLNTLIIETQATLDTIAAPQSAEVQTQLSTDLATLSADKVQLRQILINLVENAIDAKAKIVTISTTNTFFDPLAAQVNPITGQVMDAGAYVCLEISDDGIGMDTETENNIFDPFFSTKKQGHGLGLAAVLGIMRGHAGAVEVASAPNEGTSISLYFPALKAKADGLEVWEDAIRDSFED